MPNGAASDACGWLLKFGSTEYRSQKVGARLALVPRGDTPYGQGAPLPQIIEMIGHFVEIPAASCCARPEPRPGINRPYNWRPDRPGWYRPHNRLH